MGIWDRRHLLLLYAFVDIAIRFFNTDRSLPMLFSVIEDGSDDRSDEGLTLETSAFLLFTVANLRFQPSC